MSIVLKAEDTRANETESQTKSLLKQIFDAVNFSLPPGETVQSVTRKKIGLGYDITYLDKDSQLCFRHYTDSQIKAFLD